MNSVVVKNQVKLTQWAALINEAVNSGMKLKDWLREKDITKDAYYYWRRKVADQALDAISTSFVEIPVETDNSAIPDIQSIISEPVSAVAAEMKVGSTTISVFESATAEFLAKLIKVAADVK